MKQFNEPADALVYSMTVALGFAMLENIEYMLRYDCFSLYVRQFNAVPLHLGLAAIWGMGIAKAKFLNGEKYTRTPVP
jgi:protease PrsW